MVVVDDEGGGDVVVANAASRRRRRVSWWSDGEATIEYAVDEATMTNSRRLLIVAVELVVLPLSSERRDGDEVAVLVEWISADAERRWTIEEMSFFLVVKYVCIE